MSDYLNYTLWRQREERMPRELERQRVALERREAQLSEQHSEQQLCEESVREAGFDDAAIAEPTDAVGASYATDESDELDFELVTR